MFRCEGCKELRTIPDTDKYGKVFYYDTCRRYDTVVGFHERKRRPEYCTDRHKEHDVLSHGCGELDVLFNPVLWSVDVIDYRMKQYLNERSY